MAKGDSSCLTSPHRCPQKPINRSPRCSHISVHRKRPHEWIIGNKTFPGQFVTLLYKRRCLDGTDGEYQGVKIETQPLTFFFCVCFFYLKKKKKRENSLLCSRVSNGAIAKSTYTLLSKLMLLLWVEQGTLCTVPVKRLYAGGLLSCWKRNLFLTSISLVDFIWRILLSADMQHLHKTDFKMTKKLIFGLIKASNLPPLSESPMCILANTCSDVHLFLLRVVGCWNLSQYTLGKRRGTTIHINIHSFGQKSLYFT